MWQDGTSPALQSGQPSGRHCPFGATSVFQTIQVELRLQTPKRGPTGGADFAPTKEHKTEKPIARLIKKKRERTQINKIRNEKGEVRTDITEVV